MLALAFAALALTGSVADPVDGAGTPAQDIVEAHASFDSAAGSTSLTLRMRAALSSADAARIHGILYREDPARPGVCPSDDTNAELGRFEASTDPALDDATFGPARIAKSVTGAEVTLSGSAPALVGAQAVCASATLSKGRPLDVLDRPVILQAGFTPPPPVVEPPRIALASKAARVSHGVALLRLEPFGARTKVGVAGRAGRGSKTVDAGRAVKVRVKLTRAGRRLHRARFTVTALQAGAPRASRSVKVRLAR